MDYVLEMKTMGPA